MLLLTQFSFSCRCLLVQLQVRLFTCSASSVVVYLFNFKCRCYTVRHQLFCMTVLYHNLVYLSTPIRKYFYLPQGCRLASPTPIMASGIRIAASIAIVVMSIVCYPLPCCFVCSHYTYIIGNCQPHSPHKMVIFPK